MRYYTRKEWGAAPPRGSYVPVQHHGQATLHYSASRITPTGHTDANSVAAEKPKRPGPKWYAQWRDKSATRKARRNASKAIRKYNRAMKEWRAKQRYGPVPAYIVRLEMQTARAIQDYHFRAAGLDNVDIAYHVLVFATGNYYEGRPVGTLGSHAAGANRTLGICLVMGPGDKPTAAMQYAVHEIKAKHGITEIKGHRQRPGNSTSCPGDEVIRVFNL